MVRRFKPYKSEKYKGYRIEFELDPVSGRVKAGLFNPLSPKDVEIVIGGVNKDDALNNAKRYIDYEEEEVILWN